MNKSKLKKLDNLKANIKSFKDLHFSHKKVMILIGLHRNPPLNGWVV